MTSVRVLARGAALALAIFLCACGGDDRPSTPAGPSTVPTPVSNRAPEAARALVDLELEDLDFLPEPEPRATLNLNEYFRDPDGDALTFAVANTDEDVLGAYLDDDGSTLDLYTLEPGQATVTVTATDPDSLELTSAFTVTVLPNPFRADISTCSSTLGSLTIRGEVWSTRSANRVQVEGRLDIHPIGSPKRIDKMSPNERHSFAFYGSDFGGGSFCRIVVEEDAY